MSFLLNLGWGAISALLTFVSAFSYMKAIYTKEIKRPVISTLSLWLGIGVLLFIASLKLGASVHTTLLPVLMGVINPAIIFALSLRHGEYSWHKIDTICVLLCIITVVIWQTTESALLGLIGGIVADIAAAIPMAVKSWRDPKDEPLFPWIVFAIGSAVNIFAVMEWKIEHFLFPVYMTIMGAVISLPLIIYRVKIRIHTQ